MARSIQFIVRAPLDMQNERIENTPGIASGSDLSISSMGDTTIDVGEVGARENLIINSDALDINAEGGITIDAGTGNNITFNSPVDLGNTSVIGIVVDARANGDHEIMPGDFFFVTPTEWYWNPDTGESRTITVTAGVIDTDVSTFGFIRVGDGGGGGTSNVPNPGAAGEYLRSLEADPTGAPGVYTWGTVNSIPNTHVSGLGNLAVASIVYINALPASQSVVVNQFSILIINSEHWYWNPSDTLTAKVLSTNADGNVFSFHELDRDGNISNLTTITPAGDIDLIIAAVQSSDMIRIGDESGTAATTDHRLPTPVRGQFLIGNGSDTEPTDGWDSVASDVARSALGLRDLATARVFDIPNQVSGIPGGDDDIIIPADSLVYYAPQHWYFLPLGRSQVVIPITAGEIDSTFDPNSSAHSWIRIGDGHGETIRVVPESPTPTPVDYENAILIGGQGIDITVGTQTIGVTEYDNVVNFQFDGSELANDSIPQTAIDGLDSSITSLTDGLAAEVLARQTADNAVRTDLEADISHLSDTIANQDLQAILRRSGVDPQTLRPTGSELILSTDEDEFIERAYYDQDVRGHMVLSIEFRPQSATLTDGIWTLTDDLGDGMGTRTLATLPTDAGLLIGRYDNDTPVFGADASFLGHPKFARWQTQTNTFFYDLEIIGDDTFLTDNSGAAGLGGERSITGQDLIDVFRNWRVIRPQAQSGVVTLRPIPPANQFDTVSISPTTGTGDIITADGIPQMLSADNVTATIPTTVSVSSRIELTLNGNDFNSLRQQYINGQPLTLYRQDAGGSVLRIFFRYVDAEGSATNSIRALYVSHEGDFTTEQAHADWNLYPGWAGTGSGSTSAFLGRIRANAGVPPDGSDPAIPGFNLGLNAIRVGAIGNLSLSPANFNLLSAMGNLSSLTLDVTTPFGTPAVIYQFKFKVSGTSTSVVPNTISGEVTYVNQALANATITNQPIDWVVTFGGFAQEQPSINVSNVPLTVGEFETAFDNDNNVRYFVEYTLNRPGTVDLELFGQTHSLNGGREVTAGIHTETFLGSSLNPTTIGGTQFADVDIYGTSASNLSLDVSYTSGGTERIQLNYSGGVGRRRLQFATQEELQDFITDKAEFRTNIGISDDNVELRAETNLPLISSALNTTTTYNLQGFRYHTTPGNTQFALDLNGRRVQTFTIDNGAFDFTFTLDQAEIDFITLRSDLEVRLDPVATGSTLRSITVTRIGSGSTNFTALPTVETEDNNFTRLSRIEFEDSGNTLRFVDADSGDRAFSPAPEMTVYTDLPLAVDDITAGTYNLAITRHKVTGANTEFNLVAAGRDIETVTIPGRVEFINITFTIDAADLSFWVGTTMLDDLQLNSTLADTTLGHIPVGRLDTVVTSGGGGGSTRLTADDINEPLFINPLDSDLDIRQFGVGQRGIVPGTNAGDNFRFLRGDGTWATFAQANDEFVIGENVIPRSDGRGYAPSTIENAIVDIISGTRFDYNTDDNLVTNTGNATAPKTIRLEADLQADNEFRAAPSVSDTVTNSILVQVVENVTLDGPAGISEAITILTPGYYIADNNGNINIANVREITFETDDAGNILRSIQSISNTPVNTFPTDVQYNGRRVRGVWIMRPVQLADNWSNTIDVGPHERETNLLHSGGEQVITPLIRLNGRVEISNDDDTIAPIVIENGTITGSNLELDNISNVPLTVGEFETAFNNNANIQYFVEYTLSRPGTARLELYGQFHNLNSGNEITVGTHTELFLASSLNPTSIGGTNPADDPIYGNTSDNLRISVTYTSGGTDEISLNYSAGSGSRSVQFRNQQELQEFITDDASFQSAIGLPSTIVSSVAGGRGITVMPADPGTGAVTINAEGDGSLLTGVGDRFVSAVTLTSYIDTDTSPDPVNTNSFDLAFGGIEPETMTLTTDQANLSWTTGSVIAIRATYTGRTGGTETVLVQGTVQSYDADTNTLVAERTGTGWNTLFRTDTSTGFDSFTPFQIEQVGLAGPQGAEGPQGPAGPQGIPGPMGISGDRGFQGPFTTNLYQVTNDTTDTILEANYPNAIGYSVNQGRVIGQAGNNLVDLVSNRYPQATFDNTGGASPAMWSPTPPTDIQTIISGILAADQTGATPGNPIYSVPPRRVWVTTQVVTLGGTGTPLDFNDDNWTTPYQATALGPAGPQGPTGERGRVREEMIMITQDLNPSAGDRETGITDPDDTTWDGRLVVGETYLVVNDSADLDEGREIGGFVSIFCYNSGGTLVQAASGIIAASSETLGADTIRNWSVQITGVQMQLEDGIAFEEGMIDLATSGPQGMQGVRGDSLITSIKENLSTSNTRIGLQTTIEDYDFDLETNGTGGVTVRKAPAGTDHVTRLSETIDWLLYTSTPASGIVSEEILLVTADANADSPRLGTLLTQVEIDALEAGIRANLTFSDPISRIEYTGNRRIPGTWYQFIGLEQGATNTQWILGDGQVFSLNANPLPNTDDTIIV